jgi:hypothetical protein
VLHRLLVAAGVALLALALTAPALAVRVHVRVEGARTTIFGATAPRLTPVTGTITPPSGAAVTVEAATPLGALEAASRRGEFFYRLESFSFGPYVAQIGRLSGTATTGWVFKVNGKSPPVGAHAVELKEGDRVLWYHATFGSTGGPRTLHLRRYILLSDPGQTCYVSEAVDDNGVARDVVATFHLDGRRVRRRAASFCPPRHWHTLRATATGTVRSQVVVAPRRAATAGQPAGAGLAGRA